MSSQPLADRLLFFIPSILAVILLLLTAVPWHIGVSLAPQVLWLMTLVIGVMSPAAWPPVIAFVLGLVADVLSGTPLGSQALLAVLLTLGIRAQARRLQHQLFRVRWMQATAAMLTVNLMLWALMAWIVRESPPILPVLRATLISALWFPLFYALAESLKYILPSRN